MNKKDAIFLIDMIYQEKRKEMFDENGRFSATISLTPRGVLMDGSQPSVLIIKTDGAQGLLMTVYVGPHDAGDIYYIPEKIDPAFGFNCYLEEDSDVPKAKNVEEVFSLLKEKTIAFIEKKQKMNAMLLYEL